MQVGDWIEQFIDSAEKDLAQNLVKQQHHLSVCVDFCAITAINVVKTHQQNPKVDFILLSSQLFFHCSTFSSINQLSAAQSSALPISESPSQSAP